MSTAMISIKSFRIKNSLILENVAFYGVLVSILLAAVPNGTVDPWNESLFTLSICLFAIIRVVENLLIGNFKLADPLLLAPLTGIVILAFLQLIPTYLGNEFNSLPYIESIASADQYETKRFITIFTAFLLTGEILLRYATTRRRLLTLIYLVITIGVGSALFGLFRQIFPISENSLFESVIGQNADYAQFINRNHFAFLMEMTLGLLIGLVLKAKLAQSLKLMCWLTIAIVCIVTIMANSRGAILSMTGLGLFAIFVHFSTRNKQTDNYVIKNSGKISINDRLKVFLLPIAVCCIFVCVAVFTGAFVGGDPVATRIESIQNEVQENEDNKIQRSEIWQSTIELIKKNPVTGVGFGAYGMTITQYDHLSGNYSLQQSHNDYLEVLANGGIITFLLMLIFLVILFIRIRKQFASVSRLQKASCFGTTIGIVGVMLHSFVDFGLHTTINALVFIVLIVISTARLSNFEKA